ncbi:MAG: phosphoribosylaminoimidazolesuccinocarboxamide synthase [candidate division Zixibacteria bacterium]|nr:phosphoribosylaminoimidazolesuccinocarboxamide synthase [candidate division Zixibacteria bacterium]
MENTDKAVLFTDIEEYPLFSRGKVRDVYDLDDKLLIVSSDRISAFDVILPKGIPGKGKILTSMSLFWFDFLKDVIESHLIASEVDDFPADLHKYREQLEGRSMLVKKAKRVDIECIVRGYISGSMWKELLNARANGANEVHGFSFPSDLIESDKLPAPIFTPSTKADDGHDENISFTQMCEIVDNDTAELCRNKSIEIYSKAADYALSKGIIIADTKFEFGYKDDRFILIDEVLSPDSSRFWPKSLYKPGAGQPSFDKQFIRDYLSGLDWDKTPPGPELPAEILEKSVAKYREAMKMLTGK